MKLNDKIDISLRDFILHGKFDYLTLGRSKAWILNNFPDPDWGPHGRSEAENIWVYGNIEFHFDGDLLRAIFTDYIKELNGGQSLALDKWILVDGKAPTLEQFLNELNRERVNYQVRNQIRHGNRIWEGHSQLQVTESRVRLDFCSADGDPNNPGMFELSSISLDSNNE